MHNLGCTGHVTDDAVLDFGSPLPPLAFGRIAPADRAFGRFPIAREKAVLRCYAEASKKERKRKFSSLRADNMLQELTILPTQPIPLSPTVQSLRSRPHKG
ncbi:hypothetical protein KIL84_004246 [Mauremys mutica]|uniref:Uncharacterized protein n=1 Tax=Mauremys mutica TaxID=74926 RepID=A0A9D3XJR1_9SAUR|nr:hypothetical protein KIL84_004246 [Mauremys mutica]